MLTRDAYAHTLRAAEACGTVPDVQRRIDALVAAPDAGGFFVGVMRSTGR